MSDNRQFKYPGQRAALDGNTAVIMCERESTDAAGAYPITPSTQMGEYWAEAAAAGHINISERPLIFIEPEGEHAAAGVTAGLSMTGLRSANFSSGQGIAYMHESLYAAVGKRLTYVLNMGCRAMTKATLNVHAGHDDYHCADDTGFFQVFGKNAQHVCDLNIIAHKIAELALTPGIVAQDGFLTTHLIESLKLPERDLIAEYLGRPDDIIDCPTPAQRMLYGDQRRRIPEIWTVDNPVMAGLVQNQDAYMQSVAAQRPYFFDHIKEISEQCFREFYELTGRQYERILTYRLEDADYVLIGQGSVIPSAEVVADYLRQSRGIKIGVIDLVMYRPFPGDLIGRAIQGKRGVAILERVDQPLAEDLPIMREVRSVITKCLENGQDPKHPSYPDYAVYKNMSDAPRLYSGSFGLGSRDLQAEGLIAAVENMLPDGKHKKMYYLSIDFYREQPFTPKQEIHQQAILDSYPHVKELALRGSENPNLMPKDSITVRFHSVGGWGAITTGKNLAMTLFDLLGWHIKANPKYGSEKKGQPTTYYLSAAPEPIRMNCEYFYVDVVMSPDPNVFKHTNPLAGLKKGGVFIIQSDLDDAQAVWRSIPARFREIIIENEIRLYYIDAFKIAREEATDAELQFRMQGNAFQGSFFAASPVMSKQSLSPEALLEAIEAQIQHKFGSKGARVVQDNMRVVRRGFDEVHEVTNKPLDMVEETAAQSHEPPMPVMLKMQPKGEAPLTDIHRFWEQTGNFYLRGMGNDNLTDPFIGLSFMPAITGVFRDMTGIRFEHPVWDPQKCTGCGKCWSVCPDTAIPGIVNDFSQVFNTVIQSLIDKGTEIKHLRRAVSKLESRTRAMATESGEQESVARIMQLASAEIINAAAGAEQQETRAEFDAFFKELNGYQLALTRPFFTLLEKNEAGSGGLLSINVNPTTCKGCGECIEVCGDDALRFVTQTPETLDTLRKNMELWHKMPNTPTKYVRVDSLEEGIGSLETILLDKGVSHAVVSGDGACLGCTEKTVVRLFVGTVEALMQPRVAKHVQYLDELIAKLEQHIKMKLADNVHLDDTGALDRVMNRLQDKDLTLASLSSEMEREEGVTPIDDKWLRRNSQLVNGLKSLRWKYTQGVTGKGRASMGMTNSTGCTSVWGSTYPFNPYPFPWTNHLFQDSPSLAMGIFEGHMAHMAEGFKLVRQAELELKNQYNEQEHAGFFQYFNWHQFTDEEFALCPPVVALGGDGAMYDIGFQNLSRALISGKPIKVVVMDTQVYSNTGGQACTSGFTGQVSDMAQYGKAIKGKEEIRKEIGLIGMAHRNTYVMQGAISNISHLIEGFIEGLQTHRPALFNVYCACQPEHGIADDAGAQQARLAVESRAYPLFRYNPDKGDLPVDCFDLSGNPMMDDDWPGYTLRYLEDGLERSMELPLTFADFALTEARFRKHFRKAPPDTWNENMLPLHEFLQLDKEDREGRFPYIWATDQKQRLSRVLVAAPIVESCEDRRHFWRMLKALAGAGVVSGAESPEQMEQRVRSEVVGRISAGLIQLASGNGGGGAIDLNQLAAGSAAAVSPGTANPAAGVAAEASAVATVNANATGESEYMAPYIDTDLCTACDECVRLNGNIFAYNENKKAFIKNPDGGPYMDLVKAAEKCTAGVIHPGLPKDRSAKDIDKWIKRGEKYN